MQKVLEDDPTAYEYDSVYDTMEKKKKDMEQTTNKKKDQKVKTKPWHI